MPQENSNGVDKVMTLSGYGDGSESGDVNRQEHRQGEKMVKKKRRHPLKMPLRTDPVTNRIICRFHNYDAQSGCKKYNHCCQNPGCGEENTCPLDHETCHICLTKGHPAHRCSHLDNPDSDIWEVFCSLTLKNTRPHDYPTNKTVLGDTILWIGDTATVAAIPSSSSLSTNDASGDGDNATAETTFIISPPKIHGFIVGEDDQLGRCRRQKKIEAAFMLQLGHGSVIVDAGAHLGDTILTLAIHARTKNRTDLRFVVLEPCPEKCDFIRAVVAANHLTVQVICSAVGDSIGVVQPASNAKERAKRDGSLRYEYYIPNQQRGMDAAGQCVETSTTENTSSIEPSNYCDGELESRGDTSNNIIRVITLDSIIDQISPLGMLHIDVEGWESNVLRGAKKSLTRTIPKHSNSNKKNRFPCYVIAEAWTEKESLRRGVSGNAEEKIVRVMEDEVNDNDSGAGYRFERINDIVDIERNLVYVRKRKG